MNTQYLTNYKASNTLTIFGAQLIDYKRTKISKKGAIILKAKHCAARRSELEVQQHKCRWVKTSSWGRLWHPTIHDLGRQLNQLL